MRGFFYLALLLLPALALAQGVVGPPNAQGPVTVGNCTKWLNIGTIADAGGPCGSGGGTVTSITAGTGLTAAPNPIISTGTISLTTPISQSNILTCAANQIVFDNVSGQLACSSNITWVDSTLNLVLGVGVGSPTVQGADGTTGVGNGITLKGGNGAGAGIAGGATALLIGGTGGPNGGNGGSVILTGGPASATSVNAAGGPVTINGGTGGTGPAGNGGSITAQSGTPAGSVTANSGNVSFSTRNGGDIATTTANSGVLTFQTGRGGNLAATTANAGNISFTGGAAGATPATATGASIIMRPGQNGAAGTTAQSGQIILQDAAGVNTLIIDQFGNIICTCVTTAAATDGFSYLGAVAAVPTGVPAHTTGAYANSIPMRYDTADSRLYAYNGAWINVSDLSHATGTLNNPAFSGHLSFSGSAPVVSACGTGPSIDANATDNVGTVTVGTVAAASCTVTFATAYSTFNHCRVTSQSTIASFAYSYTLSVLTVTGTSLVGDKFDYNCDGT